MPDEVQSDLADEAMDNYPGDFGRLYDPSMEPSYALLGAVAGARQEAE